MLFKSSSVCDIGNRRESNQDSIFDNAKNGVFAVADGMGGMQAGDWASELAMHGVKNFYNSSEKTPKEFLRSVQQCNEKLYNFTEGRSGSTLSALWIHDQSAECLHVGDSRIYHFLPSLKTTKKLTRDHNPPGQANALTNYFGMEKFITFDSFTIPVNSGDRFLICSDGLHGELHESEIIEKLEDQDLTVADISDSLLKSTLNGPALDNISIVVVEVE